MHSPPFTVAGMSSSTAAHHAPNLNLNAWSTSSSSHAGPLAASFGDGLSQSRSHYQPGYLMSTSQNTSAQTGSQRVDEVPVVPTKAKMNHVLVRGTASDFGMDSMFESTRKRQTLADEDAPPMNSVNDIPNEIHYDTNPAHFQPKSSTLDRSTTQKRPGPGHLSASASSSAAAAQQQQQPLYIVVFGYPPEKYPSAVEYFRSLGATATEPELHGEIANCFRIGYADPAEALRAVRKNGEVLGGTFMVGAKWADPVQAETVLGQSIFRSSVSALPYDVLAAGGAGAPGAMNVDHIPPALSAPPPTSSASAPATLPGTPAVGTPIKLAPSSSAFKRAAAGGAGSKPATPHRALWGSTVASVSAPVLPSMGSPSAPAAPGAPAGGTASAGGTPSKGVLGQVSDLIFGW